MYLACAFAGHRPSKFRWGYDDEAPDCMRLKLILLEQIVALIENGVTIFYSGMAQGTDLWAAQIVLKLKNKYKSLVLNCILPCETQADRWSPEARERYFNTLEKADHTYYVSRHYTDECMARRNRFMIDHAGFVIAVYNGESKGGTAQTVRYALSQHKALIIINPNTFEIRPYTITVGSLNKNDQH